MFLGDNLDSRPFLPDTSALDAAQITKSADQLFLYFLDDVCLRLQSADEAIVHNALDELFMALRERKLHTTDEDWAAFVERCRRHPVMGLLHQDPFTSRAYQKPRGYAGDAIMMDFIYGREEQWAAPPAAAIGERVFRFTTLAPASEGVRARRAFMASCIDRLVEEKHRPHILAIASGHLREATLSVAVKRRRTGRFVALDVDGDSIAEVQRCYGHLGVETVVASFRKLLTEETNANQFDLVYSTGLFDYLNQRTGRRLVSKMFEMLRPGGKLIVANFLPGVRDIGYMEVFMDWNLIYRSRRDMVDLAAEIADAEIRQVTLHSEEQQNIIFLQVTRN